MKLKALGMRLLEKSVISDESGPYMVRWRIIDCQWFGIYLHKIMRSDNDRHFHDHPFDFLSIMLAGGYSEVTPQAVVKRNAPSVCFRRAEHLHRLILSSLCWTLIFRGGRRRQWGFQTDDGWVDWEHYGPHALQP
jgi:hypothetical protein